MLRFFYALGVVGVVAAKAVAPDGECWWCGDSWGEHGCFDAPCLSFLG